VDTRFSREIKGKKFLGEISINGRTTLETRLKNKACSDDGVDMYLFRDDV
jgi:hypothetical protein